MTTTADELNNDGDCSLREAIQAANTNSVVDACVAGAGDDTVTLPAGTYTLTITGTGEESNVTGDLDILGDLTMSGAGAESTVIDGGKVDRVLHIQSGRIVEIDGVTITNGKAPSFSSGGGVFNQGITTLTASVVSNNTSAQGHGGGLRNDIGASLIITNSTISGNYLTSTFGAGAGISGRDNSTLTLTNTTVSNNTVVYDGGGIHLCCNNLTVNITNSTISGNQGEVEGGGFYYCCGTGGTISITDSTISGNSTGFGGAIYSCCGDETFIITRTVISGNSATGYTGGGIENEGSITVVDSTISGNNASTTGGGIQNEWSMTVVNSTISGNSASTGGGGIYSDGSDPLTVSNSTISGNSATGGPGGGIGSYGKVTVRNSIVAGNNAASAPDVSSDRVGDFISQGHNLIGDGTGSTEFTATGDLVGTGPSPIDPLLGILKPNGGSTFTHALLPGSPAIDVGNPAAPGSGGNACDSTDQRGVARPMGCPV